MYVLLRWPLSKISMVEEWTSLFVGERGVPTNTNYKTRSKARGLNSTFQNKKKISNIARTGDTIPRVQ